MRSLSWQVAMTGLTMSHRKALMGVYCGFVETFPSPLEDVPGSVAKENDNWQFSLKIKYFRHRQGGSEWMAWQVDEDLDDLKEVSAVPVQVTFTSNQDFSISQDQLTSKIGKPPSLSFVHKYLQLSFQCIYVVSMYV